MRTYHHGLDYVRVIMKVQRSESQENEERKRSFSVNPCYLCPLHSKKQTVIFLCPVMRISAHRGKKRAYVAVAHSMLIAIYHILKDSVVFKDLGDDYHNQFNKERKINAYLKKLKALGWEAPL